MNKVEAKPTTTDQAQACQQTFAEKVLQSEAQAIGRIVIGPSFHDAVELILRCTSNGKRGAVVVSGLGKSGLIGQKLSATFASTGTPSHFLHPTEAMHGDLGRVRREDVVVLLTFRGNTDEIVSLAGILKQDGVPVIAIVGKGDSEAARLAAVMLSIGDVAEACPLNLAPSVSTTAMLALGDALALCVMRQRNFGVEDYKKFHPGGGLGRLLMPVVEAIRFRVDQNLPLIRRHTTIDQAYAQAGHEAQASGLRRPGALLIVEDDGTLAGIFTDGDLRRAFIKHGSDAWHYKIDRFIAGKPTSLPDTALIRDAVRIVREHRFDDVPVVDASGRPIGLIDVQDLVALKVIEA